MRDRFLASVNEGTRECPWGRLYGPAPGLLVGGPNYYYDASYTIPDRQYPARAYRDFSVGCDWDGAQCLAASWELTEPDDGYQGPLILLISFFM